MFKPTSPSDRPPLSKGLWKGKPLESIWRKIDAQGVTLHLGRQARTLDPPNKRVTDDQGTVYLDLPKGIPSHDTFERVFDALDPQAFQQCLLSWLHALSGTASLQQVAIDGKVLRGLGQGGPLGPLHSVNAWATEQSLHLGQVAVDSDSN